MTETFATFITVLGWVSAFLAAFAMLDMVKRLESRLDGAALGWLTGASVAFATGLWSGGVLGLVQAKLPYAVGYHPAMSGVVWLTAAVLIALALSVACRRATPVGRGAVGAGLLASGIVLTQLLFLETLGLQPGIKAPGSAVAMAWAIAFLGCGSGLRLHAEARVRAPRHLPAWQALSALLVAVAVVMSQGLVVGAAGLDVQTSSVWRDRVPADSMTLLVTVGSTALLSMLLLLSLLESRWRVSLQRANGDLQQQSLYDPLTELPNRQLFEGTLAQATQRADASQGRVALLLINLDGFKPINESFGHRAGDRVLREIAKRLRGLAQPHMVARLEGDEFLLLLPDDPSAEDAAGMAARVLASTCLPCRIHGREVSVTSSIGIANYPKHGALSTLMAHADAAMRVAKASGGATYCFFEARMVSGLREQTDLLRDLRCALAQGELELFYQPKIHAPTGEITGAEALMRWQHPKLGMISPTIFIPIAERYGLIGSLGNWLIDEACRQIRAWRDVGLRMRVAINLSVHQLRQPDLVERIGDALREHDVNPGLLTCEITESVAMEDAEGTIAILHRLTQLGVSISIDDFGTGHSSLSYLRKLPTSELKIDRSFVLDLETSEDARKVASAVINLAKSLDLKVVAEGVETEGQNRILREFGCDQLQGFLFAKPMSAKALALWAMDEVGPRTMNFRQSLFKDTRAVELV